MSQNTYTILKNDCLSFIAQHFNVSKEELIKLNSSQIKDPNLIYEGNTLILPLPSPIQTGGSRIATPAMPSAEEDAADTCKTHPPFADILYVPSHPKTEKKTWYAIDQKVKDLLLQEKQVLVEAIVADDTEATVKNINSLGILSKFAPKLHEDFMEKAEVEKYRALLFAQFAINMRAFAVDGQNPNDFLLNVAQLLNYEVEDSYKEEADWLSTVSTYPAELQAPNLESSSHFISKVNNQLRAEILDLVAEHIVKLEKNAEKAAGNVDAEDGSKFVFMEKLDYFSTTKQKEIASAIKTLNQESMSERKSGFELAFSSQSEAIEYLSEWPELMQRTWRDMNRSEEEEQTLPLAISPGHYKNAESIRALNLNGYAVKEQCLTPKQLIGDTGITLGPKALAGKPWREVDNGKATPIDINSSALIKQLYEELDGPARDGNNDQKGIESLVNDKSTDWAYYPTLALIAVIDATITEHKSALTQVLNTGSSPLDELFSQLLWVKKVALARMTFLKKVAEKKATKGEQSLQFTIGDTTQLPKRLTLLWDEDAFKPKKVKISGFSNRAGYNDIQVVECCLLSDGEVFYVRGPQWYMPGDDRRLVCQSAGHVQNITSKISVVEKASQGEHVIKGGDMSAALKQLAEPNFKMALIPLKAEKQFDTAFWQDSYHYQEGIGPNGKGGAYNIEAGAQLLRFSSKAEAELNSPLSSYSDLISKPRNIGGSGGVSATFTALQAQLTMSFWLPLQEDTSANKQITPHKLNIKYQDAASNEHNYQAGYLCAHIIGNIYGLAAASCQLSTKVAIGPTNIGEGFGIKGSTVCISEPNIRNGYNLTGASFNETARAKIAAEASAGVDVFAGVEAGGSLTAAVYWAPPTASNKSLNEEEDSQSPPQINLQKLGSVQGKVAAAAGVGAQAEFRLVFHGGILLVVAKAGLVFGPGCQGKTEIVVDTERLDDFLDCLLGVLKQSNFRKLSVFGEADKNGVNNDFELLNDILTIGFAMGLSASKVLLMPFSVWQDYKSEALRKEYAPFLAVNINVEKKSESEKVRQWVVKLPPETLANLLTALCKKQTSSHLDGRGKRVSAEEANVSQAQAIVNIMKWLATDQNDDDITNQRQWKETLIMMADLPKGRKDYPAEWKGYREQWFNLAYFVKTAKDDDLKQVFSNLSRILCKNMVLIRKQGHSFSEDSIVGKLDIVTYQAIPVECISNSIARINWSLDEITF
ncbi:LysM peptidoglycan-binding domain-containing protein [Vibrio kasasachensis]|uniref:LysM peptidoglycan-binding domain-containing protein n=1 Tax=Vibrio kasasachensis TaxID=2910248 RepID=UPI003D0F5C88